MKRIFVAWGLLACLLPCGAMAGQSITQASAVIDTPVVQAQEEAESTSTNNDLKNDLLGIKNVFKCSGVDPLLKQEYSGLITISRNGEVYNLQMDYDTGEKSLGTGILRGHTLSVIFKDANNSSNLGVQLYVITDHNRRLEGDWVYIGKNSIGKEICQKK
jgi:hypothetical protein